MKATGIIRRMDELGRVVIPKEIRSTLNIKDGDALELFVIDDGICYKKYTPLRERYYRIFDALRLVQGNFAVYSTTDLLAQRGDIFPDHALAAWFNRGSATLEVLPIVLDDKHFGFVVLDNYENIEFAKGVVAMAASEFGVTS